MAVGRPSQQSAWDMPLRLSALGSRAPASNLPVLSNFPMVRMGIAMFILLPHPVLLMLLVFIRERDFRFAFTSGMVLAVILLGILLGVPVT
jgi:hypothetical protein